MGGLLVPCVGLRFPKRRKPKAGTGSGTGQCSVEPLYEEPGPWCWDLQDLNQSNSSSHHPEVAGRFLWEEWTPGLRHLA